jgi:hypothetical protein
MLEWLQKKENAGQKDGFEIVEPEEWVMRLEACQHSEHPALKLLGMWKAAYGNKESGKDGGKEKDIDMEVEGEGEGKGEGEEKARPKFEMQKTKAALPVMRDVRPVDEEYIGKIWEWVKGNVGVDEAG